MSIELPLNLQRTADILRDSRMIRPDEIAPAMPSGFFDDLTAHFASPTAAPAPKIKFSPFEKVRAFMSTPAFGIAGAALIILTVTLTSTPNTSNSPEKTNFRGNSGVVKVTDPTSIVLIGASMDQVSAIRTSGDIEKDTILTADTASASKVIVNFNTATITSINAKGETLHTANLPAEKTDLLTAIAEALSKFSD